MSDVDWQLFKHFFNRYVSGEATPFQEKKSSTKIIDISQKYSRDELLKKKNPDLKLICKNLGVKCVGTKDELISRILEKNSKTTEDTLQKLNGYKSTIQQKGRIMKPIDIDSLTQKAVENMTIEKLKIIAKEKNVNIKGLTRRRDICSEVVKALFNTKITPIIPKPSKGFTADFVGEKLSNEVAKAIKEHKKLTGEDIDSEEQPVFKVLDKIPDGWKKTAAHGKNLLFNEKHSLVATISNGELKIIASSNDNGRTFRGISKKQKKWAKKHHFKVIDPSTTPEKDISSKRSAGSY